MQWIVCGTVATIPKNHYTAQCCCCEYGPSSAVQLVLLPPLLGIHATSSYRPQGAEMRGQQRKDGDGGLHSF